MSTADDKFYQARIPQRRDFASDLWMIRVQANGEFKFAPGQYATLGVQRAEKRSRARQQAGETFPRLQCLPTLPLRVARRRNRGAQPGDEHGSS